MKQLHFTCTLLTDVVLSASPATEGFNKSLDYLPGSRFLGIVAGKHYNMADPTTLNLFHNGCVRFGDAHPLTGEPTYKVPTFWYAAKGEAIDAGIYLWHKLSPDKREKLTDDGIQLQQLRNGYFTPTGTFIEIDQQFSLKSAYSSSKKRAEDEQLFGYFALDKGTVWQFQVDMDDDQYAPLIRAALTGKQRIGRSSSAQYGLVMIEETNPPAVSAAEDIPAGETLLYAVSNWSFYDDYGRPSLQPSPAQLGLPDGSSVLWEKSQVCTRSYRTWNKRRNNRDADRLIIEKGSVLAVTLSDSISSSMFAAGIGAHRSEGFGRVLANPSFLQSENEMLPFVLQRAPIHTHNNYFVMEKGGNDDLLLRFLENQMSSAGVETQIDKAVNRFINQHAPVFKGVKPSQWGQVRTLAYTAISKEDLQNKLFDENTGFCFSGSLAPLWRTKDRRGVLRDFLFSESGIAESRVPKLTEKLASEMAKYSNS